MTSIVAHAIPGEEKVQQTPVVAIDAVLAGNTIAQTQSTPSSLDGIAHLAPIKVILPREEAGQTTTTPGSSPLLDHAYAITLPNIAHNKGEAAPLPSTTTGKRFTQYSYA